MLVTEAITEILRREGTQFVATFPTNPLLEAIAAAGIKPVVCRQERVGVGIADGFTRVSNGDRIGVFTMQYGPGAENTFAGIAAAYSDSTPILLLPTGHSRGRSQVYPIFPSTRVFAQVTKSVEQIYLPDQVSDIMRRAFSQLKMGRLGPVMVEIPTDLAEEELKNPIVYEPVRAVRSAGNAEDVANAVKALANATNPVIMAGQGVLYAKTTNELIQLAELLQIPVMTTLEGKSAFPEDHPLSLGCGAVTTTGPVVHFLKDADLVLAVGTSLTRHPVDLPLPPGKKIIHVTNDTRDINKDYQTDYPVLGDAKLVLQQMIGALKSTSENRQRLDISDNIEKVRDEWFSSWKPKLTSHEVPITPYRVIWEFMNLIDPGDAIVTHDAGSSRDYLIPFYRASKPRCYIGWGKSHGLGYGLGLIIGAKIAAPQKFCVNFMGDGAFGMVGLDFETSVRSGNPITTIVLNNSIMASEKSALPKSHDRFKIRSLSGAYADMGKALGGYSERIEHPEDIRGAIQRAKSENERGHSALLEFITNEETNYSCYTPF